MIIYGPYKRKDGRKHMVVYPEGTGKNKPHTTISYPKFLVENKIGRKLLPNETIDHHNRNKTDDEISNLVIRARSDHVTLDNRRAKLLELNCIWCGSITFKKPRKMREHSKQGKAGPFCSRKCSGKYGADVQNKRIEKFKPQESPKTQYYYLDKPRDVLE